MRVRLPYWAAKQCDWLSHARPAQFPFPLFLFPGAESRTANQKPGNLKCCAPFNERTLIGQNLVGISKKREKSGLSRNQKVHSGYSD